MDALKRLPPWLASVLSIFAGLIYLAQSWYFAHTQASVLDEGLYLYKGWLYASGVYTPFQDFGPWSNHMPLSFLIPGWVQMWLGPGLRTGRLLALVTGLLSLLAIWILARRFGGRWWASGVVWTVALNPALIKMFSVQASQGLAACLLIWALVLTLGESRPLWQAALGGLIAGLVPITRINLLPVLPAIILYSYWVHGRRVGHIVFAAGAGSFLAGHALFWPGILRMWAPWFPDTLTPFLDAFRRPPNDGSLWTPEVDFNGRVLSFLQGVRFHVVALLGALGLTLFWPERSRWPSQERYRTAVILLALFGVLFAMHAWASLGQSYCVFCFPVYLSFFTLIGIVLLPLTLFCWDWTRPAARWAPLLLLVLAAGIGYGAFNTLGAALIDPRHVIQLLRIDVPRTSGSGTIPLWGLVENLYGLDYETQFRRLLPLSRMVSSTAVTVAGGVVLILSARTWRGAKRPLAQVVWVAFLAVGSLLGPTALLGGGYRTYDCSGDVIAAYEAAGVHLNRFIDSGDRVYWGTGGSPVPLLYLEDVRIHPAQLNAQYSLKEGGDPEALERFGHWNDTLARRWASEADILLLSPTALKEVGWLADLVAGGGFEPVEPTLPVHPCAPDSQILIFVRK